MIHGPGRAVKLEGHDGVFVVGKDLFELPQAIEDQQAHQGGEDGRDEITGADSQADAGHQPEAGRGGQAPHRALASGAPAIAASLSP